MPSGLKRACSPEVARWWISGIGGDWIGFARKVLGSEEVSVKPGESCRFWWRCMRLKGGLDSVWFSRELKTSKRRSVLFTRFSPFRQIVISTTIHPPCNKQVASVTLEAHGTTGRKSARMNTVVARP